MSDDVVRVELTDNARTELAQRAELVLPRLIVDAGPAAEALAHAAKTNSDPNPEEAWLRYGVWTRTNSDRGDNINIRHQFYSQRMANLRWKSGYIRVSQRA